MAEAGRVPSPLVSVIRLARPRFLSNHMPSFIVGYLASGTDEPAYLAIGIVAALLFQHITGLANTLTDRAEDAVDYPDRTAMARRVGYDRLALIVKVECAVYVLVAAALVGVVGAPVDTGVVWLLVLGGTLSYSFLHVKRRTIGSPILAGSVSAAFLWLGWHGQGEALPWLDDVHLGAILDLDLGQILTGDTVAVFPSVLVLWIFASTLAGAKDLPNWEGDAVVGYRSVYWQIVDGRHPLARVVSVMSAPYQVIIVLAIYGYTPPSPFVLFVFPATVLFATMLVRAQTQVERTLIRECGYLYWHLFLGAILLSLHPEPATVAVLAGSFVWWTLMSRFLHHDPTPVRRELATAFVGLVTRPPQWRVGELLTPGRSHAE